MKVNRKKTIKELLDQLGYKQYINESVLKTIKNEGEKEVEVEFFNLGKYATNLEVLEEYKKRNLVPDVGALITYLIENPQMLDKKYYIGVEMENNVFVSFLRWGDEHGVSVGQSDRGWRDEAWVGGRRKSSTLETSELSETLPLVLCPKCKQEITIELK